MTQKTEAELIEEAVQKLRTLRKAWVKEEYEAVFGQHDLKKLSAEGLRSMIELALNRGWCEGMANSSEVLRPEATKEAQAMLARNPIIEANVSNPIKH